VSHLVDRSPEAMTRRARWYLGIAGGRHGTIGVCLLAMPWVFAGSAFVPIFNLLPLWFWGIAMTIAGVLCGLSSVIRSGDLGRISMVISAVITLVLAAGLAIGIGAIWVHWLQVVGWDSFWWLVVHRPATVPADILKLAVAPPSPFLPVLLFAVTLKDFVICAQPLRSPFEPVLRDLPELGEAKS
jgi:hypothetical protein